MRKQRAKVHAPLVYIVTHTHMIAVRKKNRKNENDFVVRILSRLRSLQSNSNLRHLRLRGFGLVSQ